VHTNRTPQTGFSDRFLAECELYGQTRKDNLVVSKTYGAVDIVKVHSSWTRIEQGLAELGYNQPNTSTVERFNAIARRINAYQVRRSLAFAHRVDPRRAMA